MKNFFRILAVATGSILGIICIVIWYASINLPNPKFLSDYNPSSVNYIYDNRGNLLQEWGRDYRLFVPYTAFPVLLVQAFLSAEDRYFFQHPGVDILSIARSFMHNMEGKTRAGGSTITQQIAKNFLIGDERTFLRKIREAILAFQIERQLSKQKILEIYLNHIYLGKGSYGVGAAAQRYFQKDLKNLKISEIAFLAALPKYPGIQNAERIRKRRNWILKKMYQEKLISIKLLTQAFEEPVPVIKEKTKTPYGHYFLEAAKKELQKTNLHLSSARIVTTMNPWLQCIAEKSLQDHLNSYNAKSRQSLTGGLILMDAQTGEVLAHTGGYHFLMQNFDCALQAKRQVGSLFKPIIYAAAFEKGVSPQLEFYDQPLVFGTYRPKNISGRHYGRVSIEHAFIHSYNLIAVQLAQYIGMSAIVSVVRRLEIFPHFLREWSSVLGACEASLLEMCTAYACLANGGYKISPTFIKHINGTPLEQPQPKRIISEQVSFQMQHLMQRVVTDGTARILSGLKEGVIIGGKTGTTNHNKDIWFVGFIRMPSGKVYIIGVFLGFLLPKSLGEEMTAGVLATPLAHRFLSTALPYMR